MERNFFETDPVVRNIFNMMSDAVYLVDDGGVILFINHAAERLDGYTFREAKGRTVMELYGLDFTQSPLLRVASSREPLVDHIFRYYVNDQEVYQLCNTIPIDFADGTCGSFSVQRDVTKLKKIIDRNVELQKQLFAFNESSEDKSSQFYHFKDIVGEHRLLTDSKNLAYNAAQSDSPIMLCGLTGTGKELFAQSIHSASKRKNETFLAINCAAIPETLLEGILFGTVKGVYTGAMERKGLFEQANGGTLFLDEINSMPLSSQSKLLRVLEEKKVQPLGSKEQIEIDTRIISGCNEYPTEVLGKGQIRQDLFYRLAVINIMIPSLAKRKSDIFLLAHHFIAYYNEKLHKNVLAMDEEITAFFLNYSWPGNVRQLRYCIESAMNLVSADETTIKEKHLPYYLLESDEGKERFYQYFQSLGESTQKEAKEKMAIKPVTLKAVKEFPDVASGVVDAANVFAVVREQEKERIVDALLHNNGCISKAAKEMGMTRQTLVYRMKKHNISKSMN